MTETKSINRILIANRGEIACRVIRTARSMGIETVAVYSDADADAPHVSEADHAVHIGASHVGESYLVAEKILEAAKKTGADAIHPGYGFLSENAEFSKAAEAAGVTFIGPNEHAIFIMGDKARSKRYMIEAGVPCIPGYQDEDQSEATFVAEADKIGFPVMVKAAAGGGGRGMRLVHKAADLKEAIALAKSEAENAFGSGELILEKAILRPRHVEIQVFADKHGNTIHLGERDCSVQRRNQKVIEESPCPVMTEELRAKMGEAAVNAAKAVDYVGAGTVEFLLDENGDFYFLEMNTRLQVEHPVTEEVTGLDLVALQIEVARGDELGLTQDDITLTGHAIEVRLYAEDPSQDFLPASGPIDLWLTPESQDVRIDTGIKSGGEVSPFYDPMVAKIITHGGSRGEAIRLMVKALKDTALFGTANNRDFLIKALQKPVFLEGGATTAFIAENITDNDLAVSTPDARDLAIASVIFQELGLQKALAKAVNIPRELIGWRSPGTLMTPYEYATGEDKVRVEVKGGADNQYTAICGDETYDVQVLSCSYNRFKARINGSGITALYRSPALGKLQMSFDDKTLNLTNLCAVIASAEEQAGGGTIVAPMHGKLLEVLVKKGDSVKKGDRLAILEAMKMQHEILSEVDGEVKDISGVAGNQIAADDIILEIEEDA